MRRLDIAGVSLHPPVAYPFSYLPPQQQHKPAPQSSTDEDSGRHDTPAPAANASSPSFSALHHVRRVPTAEEVHVSEGLTQLPLMRAPPAPRDSNPFFTRIFSQATSSSDDLRRLADRGDEARQAMGVFYQGPKRILGAHGVRVTDPEGKRKAYNTAKAFKQGTSAPSANAHMEASGYETLGQPYHRTHIKGWSQHGPSADHPDNIVAATKAANGLMTHIDSMYPEGYVNLNYAVVQNKDSSDRVAHKIVMALAHPDLPDVPLFTHVIDPHASFNSLDDWQEMQRIAHSLSPENLEQLHARNLAAKRDTLPTIQGLHKADLGS